MGRKGGRGKKPSNQWKDTDMQNEKMAAYYKAQEIMSDEEYLEVLDAFRRALPTTFRFTGSRANALSMKGHMERTFLPYLSGKSFEGKPLKAPEVIDWYPHKLAYKLDIPKQAIRKNADFSSFQKFLVMESESGNIVRQEIVSMIPPLLMNIQSDSTCLDMCAAPGSKTSQMVEYLHLETSTPSGFVLANDSDFKRAYMLVHQVKRLNSPNFIVTNHDATFLANFHNDSHRGVQKFDRVLADVPCSGDGTLRKNFDIWKNWNVKAGLSLHPTQVNCLRRGLQMLKVGGRLVYSTCSLNPIENEAVLHAVLSTLDGAAHLVDVSAELPGLQRRPGLHTWKPTDHDGNFITSIDDVKKDKHRFPTSIFPPSSQVAADLHLERAIRVYPHLADTGGFFVAVIDKVAEISADFGSVRFKAEKRKAEDGSSEQAKASKRSKADTEGEAAEAIGPDAATTLPSTTGDLAKTDDNASLETGIEESKNPSEDPLPHEVEQVIPKPKFMKSLNDEYFKFLPADHPDLVEIFEHYGLSEGIAKDCFLSRNISGEPVRSLYYTSSLIKNVLVHNEGRIKFVHAGVKIFHKQNTDNLQDGSKEAEGMCKWRIAQDGIDVVRDFVSKDKFVTCNLEEFVIFMQHEYPRASLFPERENSVIEQLKGRRYGCYILRFDPTTAEGLQSTGLIEVPLWKSKVTIQMMIARKDKEAMYTRLTGKELPAAIKVDSKVVKDLEGSTVAGEDAVSTIEEDKVKDIDVVVAEAAAREEEGTASAVL